MSQIDIMKYLDNHKGKYYTISALAVVFQKDMNRSCISRKLRSIIKRDEYESLKVYNELMNRTISVYGRVA